MSHLFEPITRERIADLLQTVNDPIRRETRDFAPEVVDLLHHVQKLEAQIAELEPLGCEEVVEALHSAVGMMVAVAAYSVDGLTDDMTKDIAAIHRVQAIIQQMQKKAKEAPDA